MKQTPSASRSRRSRKPPWLLTVAAISGAVAIGVVPTVTAEASCAGSASVQEAIRSAPTVFVGTVTGLSSGDRVASVRVDDVWRGGTIPPSVEVVGTPDASAAATSVDRTYVAGSQYLFVPEAGGPQHFSDNSCTATQIYTANLAAMRPTGALGAPAQPASTFPIAAAVGAPLVVLIGTAVVVVARRRRRDSP